MQYVEFTAIADDGDEVRLRKTWPKDSEKAKTTPPMYTHVGLFTRVEVLSETRFRVNGKVYVWHRHPSFDEAFQPRSADRHGDPAEPAKDSG